MLKSFGDIIGANKSGNFLHRMAKAERFKAIIAQELEQDVKVIVGPVLVKIVCSSQDQAYLLNLKSRRVAHLMHRVFGAKGKLKIITDRA